MKQFDDLDKLLEEISQDSNLTSSYVRRFPVRIILLNSFDDLLHLLNVLNVQRIDLSEIQITDKYWFTTDNIIKIVYGVTYTSIIYPISEVFRFLQPSELKSAMNTILNFEDVSNDLNYRIYIPLVSFHSKLSLNYWDSFYRENEGAKIWKYYRRNVNPIKVFKSSSEISSSLFTIRNTEQWLSFWKAKNNEPIISVCNSLNKRWDQFLPDECFEVGCINSIKDILAIVYDFHFPICYIGTNEYLWKELLTTLEQFENPKALTLDALICNRLNINTLTCEKKEIFTMMLKTELEFDKWLIFGYYIKIYPYSYLSIIESSINQYKNIDFYRVIYNFIIEVSNNDPYYNIYLEERRGLIELISKTDNVVINTIACEFFDKLRGWDIKPEIMLLSNRTKIEKQLLLRLINDMDENQYQKNISIELPDIASYLNYDIVLECWFNNENLYQYMRAYNLAKARNTALIDTDGIFSKLNSNPGLFYSWYVNFDSINKPELGRLFQIDGLGVEWLPFIINYVNTLDTEFLITDVCIRKANLPTVTAVNKVEGSEFIREGSIDEYIHKIPSYKAYDSLLDQIEIVKNNIKKILLAEDTIIYLTGDHGISNQCLHRYGRIGSKKFPDADHEGRCARVACQSEENSDYIYKNGYCIALNHNSLNNLPRREVHGGATPEEVLVPFVKFERKSNTISRSISIVNIEGNENLVILKILPKPISKPICSINKANIEVIESNDVFKINLSGLPCGNLEISISIDGSIYKKAFNKIGAIVEEELF